MVAHTSGHVVGKDDIRIQAVERLRSSTSTNISPRPSTNTEQTSAAVDTIQDGASVSGAGAAVRHKKASALHEKHKAKHKH